ncbi:MAG: DUF3604 domain-containing protein [Maricaulaceae bacterium]
MKKAIMWVIGGLVLAVLIYKVLASISIRPIDKSFQLGELSSLKSRAEHYALGYQPDLIYSETRERCAAQYPTKKAMFGDLHIHTALSADAFPDGTRTFPDDVYKFAKGQAINIPTPEGEIQRTMQLPRPLDFAAVTDHAETFGEGYICRTPGAFAGYESKACQKFRAGGEAGVRVFMTQNAKITPSRREDVCGKDLKDCKAADKIVWDDVIRSAEDAYDRTADCGFTSFVGYEYTRAPNAMHLHRNNIFKNAEVPARALTHQSHPLAHLLLQGLEQECRQGIAGCDVISIPHNSNISGGNAFNPRELEGFSVETQSAYRAYRNSFDRLMEITQHKGTSECINGVSDILGDTDELCDVEALRQFDQEERAVRLNSVVPDLAGSDSPECSNKHFDPKHNLSKGFCLSSRDYARGALLAGMETEAASGAGAGANPYEFGFIGSSDTHISLAGATEEVPWQGHIAYETDLEGRLGEAGLGRYNRLVSNPGGLAGIYASENSRDAIFQSMKRREAFATSGTRIEPRFFAGDFDGGICDDPNWLARAYAGGTPMGSKLAARAGGFDFIAQARRDDRSLPLERLQLVKGWLEPNGEMHNKVIDLAVNESGADKFCAVYRDEDYNPEQPAYYYVRTAELSSARWSAAQCAATAEEDRPEACTNEQPETIQEMAWTSPIWITPNYTQPIKVPHNEDIDGSGHGH